MTRVDIREERAAPLEQLRARLAAHLSEADDPCDDRGVEWPCDVARALNKCAAVPPLTGRPAPEDT